ncbi:hypothetical protein ACFVHB_38465 [Kitasatospora sp. NPDC127111]|uniref:hypothetical protein n=1 Tax=Kitasatospora sp. NPDC127111 TaxID=3345363 RepID=UPI00362DFA9E
MIMVAWAAGLWGLLGAALVEGSTLYAKIYEVGGFPWQIDGQPKIVPYLVAAALRLGLGIGLAAAFAASNQVSGAIAAVSVGVAAPQILKTLSQRYSRPDAATDSSISPSEINAEVQSSSSASKGGA